MLSFEESRFKQRIQAAAGHVKSILETTRNPALAGEVSHSYEDKFALAESITYAATQALLNALELVQIDTEKLKKLKDWSNSRSVSLRLRVEETCEFVRHEQHEEESASQGVTEVKSILGTTKFTSKTVTTIHEYFWAFAASYELIAFAGSDVDEALVIYSRKAHHEIKTRVDQTPRPKARAVSFPDLNVRWLLDALDTQLVPSFRINRESKNCHTPRRNEEVEATRAFFIDFYTWAETCIDYFRTSLFPTQSNVKEFSLDNITSGSMFVPVLPFFEDPSTRGEPPANITATGFHWDKDVKLMPSDVARFMEHQRQCLSSRLAQLGRVLPGADGELVTQHEARLIVSFSHVRDIISYWHDSINYLEHLLRVQLISAIGKEVQVSDITEYMTYHNRRIFKEEFAPSTLCFNVRRPMHSPEGTISVVTSPDNDGDKEPVRALQHTLGGGLHLSRFALDAATTIKCLGPRIVHALVCHTFGGSGRFPMQLTMRARQFSSYIVILGNMISGGTLAPKSAIILSNKDEVLVPLLLETLPTPQAFRDAIESLSPQQQAFAKAFRSMQLESTLFGLMVIQIKPALEKLLNLPNDSLTKEIELSQDLQDLFMTYQVPSDLLSFDPEMAADGVDASVEDKVAQVKQHVGAMQAMIAASKQRELDEARAKAELELQLRLQAEAEARRQEEIRRQEAEARRQQEVELERLHEATLVLENSSRMCKSKSKKQAPQLKRKMASQSSVSPSFAASPKSSAAPSRDFSVSRSSVAPPYPVPAPPPSSSPAAPQPSSSPAAPQPSAPAPVSTVVEARVEAPNVPEVVEAPEIVQADQADNAVEEVGDGQEYELTQLPTQLDGNFDKFDADNALHSLIITTGPQWQKKAQKSLLSSPQSSVLGQDELKTEKQRTFDLLDALTRSGALSLDETALHVLVGASHDFAQTVMDTLIEDNINPIAHLERSMAIIASTVTSKPARDLFKEEHLDRLSTQTPALFEE